MEIRKRLSITILLALVLFLPGCMTKSEGQTTACSHDYYLSDYQAATASQNGYNLYVCKNCGNSYREVIPAIAQSSPIAAATETAANQGYGKDSKTVRLLDIPTYSATAAATYHSDIEDSKGYHHNDCYRLITSAHKDSGDPRSGNYLRWSLNGAYTTLSGNLYSTSGYAVIWIEIYDGDEFLYSTERISKDNPSAEFEIDISGVDYLTIYPVVDPWYTDDQIIADQIWISK